MITDEDFMKSLDVDYPNQDWDNVPNPDSLPSVYCVYAKKQSVIKSLTTGKITESVDIFQFSTEYASKEEAEKFIEDNRVAWSRINFFDESLTYYKRLRWSGPYIEDSIKIVEKKPQDAVLLAEMAAFRKDILAGKKVFPMYLP